MTLSKTPIKKNEIYLCKKSDIIENQIHLSTCHIMDPRLNLVCTKPL